MTPDRSLVVEVAPKIHRLTSGVANFYLVEGDDGLTLVDAGTPADWGLLLKGLAMLGRETFELDAILLTHAHADHTGFAEEGRQTAQATVWVERHDAEVAMGAKPEKNDGHLLRYLLRKEFYRTTWSLMLDRGAKIVPIVEVSTFGDEEVIDVPGRPRAIHVPGHTPGNSVLLLEGRGVLFSGDAVVTSNPLTGRRGPQIMPSGFNHNTHLALTSLDRLRGLPAEITLPGHGEPWQGSVAEVVSLAHQAGRS